MTDHAAFVLPDALFYQQALTSSLDDGLDRPTGAYEGQDMFELLLLDNVADGHTITRHAVHDYAAHEIPSYADDLFGHILIVPSRLDLGNLLSNQTREIEVANLFLEPKDLTAVLNEAGDGITFGNLPSFPHTILSFGSYVLEVNVSPEGPPTIDGDLIFEFEYDEIPVPVTGTRIVLFHFMPQAGVTEVLEWRTDVIEAYDGTEQRIRLRLAPRQRLAYQVATEALQDMRLRGILFDWLPRVFGVPIWFEKRNLEAGAASGGTLLQVSTLYGDFRVGDLVFVYADEDTFEALEVEELTDDSITTASALINSYAAGSFVMPIRSAYMQTMTQAQRYHGGFEKTDVNFTTLSNADLSDVTGATIYDGRVLLTDGNIVPDTLPEGFDRPVVVIDNASGRVFQTSRTDRSRIRSRFTWDAPSLEQLWRVRRLLHSFRGSQVAFWVPSCRPDLVVSDTIGPSATTFRVLDVGYSAFIQARRPLADVQLILANGQIIRRRIIDSERDGDEEVLTISSAFAVTAIEPEDIVRVELLTLMRIASDEATFEHRRVGDCTIAVELVSVKE